MSDPGYVSVLHGSLEDLPTLNSRLVRIFISSTFTDTREERNLLLEDVYPKLKSECKTKYGMDFQLVDMRWGVPLDASDDHQATELCLEEIRNCQKLSTGPNFVTFLNQKHGYRPLQVSIPGEEFTNLITALRENERDTSLMEEWYCKDENAIPNVYILQPISSRIPGYKNKDNTEAKQAWNDIFQRLREDFKLASKICCEKNLMSEEEKHKYFMSVTEEEIFNGILKLPSNVTEHCLCFVRIIEDITSNLAHSKAWRFIDLVSSNPGVIDEEAQLILSQLRDKKVANKLQNFNIVRHSVRWSQEEGINKRDHNIYLQAFKESFHTSILAMIDKAVKREQTLTRDELYIEVLQHANMATDRCAMFHGRETILQEIETYLRDDRKEVLVLQGESGCGKTSIMARAAKLVPSILNEATVVLRFLGTSPDSSNLSRLLRSICEQIIVCYGEDRGQIPEDYEELKDFFISTLKLPTVGKPLVVILDSLDQLSSEHNAHKLNWLPRKLTSNVKLVVSTYTESSSLIGTLHDMYPPSSFITVPVFSLELSTQVLQSWLTKKNRSLTANQMEAVQEAFAKCSLPLFVKLIFDQVVTWRSYLPASQCILAVNVQQSIENLFSQLEKKHGSTLVSRALAYVTASETGISETELEDLLSIDDTVLTSVYQIHIPPLRRIPPLLWVRIRHDIAQYLVDKEVDEVRSLFWYHRQFIETAERRYLSNNVIKQEIHSNMADYYFGKWHGVEKPFKYTTEQMKRAGVSSPDGKADRKIAAQPLVFAEDVDQKHVHFNKRKLSKLPSHLYKANRLTELRSECLLNYEWIETKIHAMSVQSVLLDYLRYGMKESVLHKAFKAAQHTLKVFPKTLSVEITGRLLALLQTKINSDELKLLKDSMKASGKNCKLVPYRSCFNIPSESHMYSIEHPRVPVSSKMAEISNDSAHLAILSTSNELLIWDLLSGEIETTTSLPSTGDEMFNVMVKPPGYDVVVIGTTNQQKTNPICIIDINTGVIEKQMNLAKQYTTVGFTDDVVFRLTKSVIVVQIVRQALDVFNITTGQLLHEFSDQPDQMELIADATMVIAHPKLSNVLNIYSLDTFESVHQITCTDIPKCFCVSLKSDISCIIMNSSPTVLFINTGLGQELGQIVGSVDKAKLQHSNVQRAEITENYCLITTMEGFVLWDVKANRKKQTYLIPEEVKPHHKVLGFTGHLTADRKTVVAGYEKYLILWDTKSGSHIHTTEVTRSSISRMLLSPCGEYVVSLSIRNNVVTTWKVSAMASQTKDYRPLSMNDSARYVQVNRAGTTAVVRSAQASEVAIIDLALGTKRCEISEEFEVMVPYITEDGKYAVLREYHGDSCLKVWDSVTGELVRSFPVSSLNLKGYRLGNHPENMAIILEDDQTGMNTMHFCNVLNGKMWANIPLLKYNMMQILFVKNDEYCLVGIEEQTHPGVKIYTRSYHVQTGNPVRTYEKLHPKLIQMITPESDCFLGPQIHTDANGKEFWKMVMLNIVTGQTVKEFTDASPSSLLFIGHVGKVGIDQDRNIYDIQEGKKLFQFDKDGDYRNVELLPSIRSAPKVTHDERHAVWLHLSHNLLKVGDIRTQTMICVCPTHSLPFNISVTPQRIIVIGCEDGRIMMLQLMTDENEADGLLKSVFNRSQKKALHVRQSVMKTLQGSKSVSTDDKQADERPGGGKTKDTSKACLLF